MPETFDADVLSLSLVGGRVRPDQPPGLLARAAPRKSARGRDRDSIYIALALRSRTPPPDRLAHDYADLAAATYFGTPGSVTAALREAVLAVNARLLEDNLRGAAEGRHVQGHFIGAVLRGEDLYFVQAGAGLCAVVHLHGVERFPAGMDRDGKPLGISPTLDLQYSHTQVKRREVILLSGEPAPGWETMNFSHYAGLPLDEFQTRLTQSAQGDGAILAVRLEPEGAAARPTAWVAQPSTDSQNLRPTPASAAPVEATPFVATDAAAMRTPAEPTPRPARPSPGPGRVSEDDTLSDGWRKALREAWDRVRPRPRPEVVGHGVRAMTRALGATMEETVRGLRVLLARMLPEGTLQREGLFTLPPSVMMGTAIVFPMVVVAVAVVVYVRLGRTEQFRTEFAEAQVQASLARTQPDALSARPYWETTLRHLEAAEVYQQTPESFSLRQEAQGVLDQLDGITRLEFSPAVVGGMGESVNVSRLLAVDSRSFYALDHGGNRVLRGVRSANGFDLDTSFACAGGVVGQFSVGPLVDVARLPEPNPQDAEAVLGLDTTGALLYCAPGKSPLASKLLAPDTGFQSPRAVEMYVDRLYVLDPGANEVWQYTKTGGVFAGPPERYFTAVAYDLGDVVDFAIADGDLFLLHADGRLTTCSRGPADSVPACVSPATYEDERPGRAGGAQIDGAVPAALAYDPPPEPSLYFLDTLAPEGSVYQYSLRLNFRRQYRPSVRQLDNLAAFAISPDKTLFIVSGDDVYYAGLP